ncbi:MAG: hypothetical protein IJ025_02965 [Clostridia bacterium]|nr:hypothetical protein [Clostridia bacterium]
MEILERFTKAKAQDESLNEDLLFCNDSFIAVVDGVTAKDRILFNGKTGGRAAAEIICKIISDFEPEKDVFSAVEKMTAGVKALYSESTPESSAAASVIIYSKQRKEIWSIGDCQCIINGEFFSHEKELDRIVSDMRALVLEISRREGFTDTELAENDTGRQFVLPVIKKQRIFANSDGRFSYGVINGSRVHRKDIIIYKLKSGDEVVLASDGYPELCASLKESEEKLKKEIKNNPLCDGDYRSTKGIKKGNSSFDDRTYIRFKVL